MSLTVTVLVEDDVAVVDCDVVGVEVYDDVGVEVDVVVLEEGVVSFG